MSLKVNYDPAFIVGDQIAYSVMQTLGEFLNSFLGIYTLAGYPGVTFDLGTADVVFPGGGYGSTGFNGGIELMEVLDASDINIAILATSHRKQLPVGNGPPLTLYESGGGVTVDIRPNLNAQWIFYDAFDNDGNGYFAMQEGLSGVCVRTYPDVVLFHELAHAFYNLRNPQVGMGRVAHRDPLSELFATNLENEYLSFYYGGVRREVGAVYPGIPKECTRQAEETKQKTGCWRIW